MQARKQTRKAKIRKLTNQLLVSATDICLELERDDTNFNYLLDHCDEIKALIYDLKGLCYSRNYVEQD